jgi:hypothetical protein
VEGLVDHEAALGDPDGRPQRLAQRQGAEAAQLVTRSGNGIGSPVAGSMKLSSAKAAGAVSRPSMVTTRCRPAR